MWGITLNRYTKETIPRLNKGVVMTEKQIEKKYTEDIEKQLVGRKIVKVEYMPSDIAQDQFYWFKRPIILTLDDGSEIIPSMDDEGNDGGALFFYSKGDWETFGVLGV